MTANKDKNDAVDFGFALYMCVCVCDVKQTTSPMACKNLFFSVQILASKSTDNFTEFSPKTPSGIVENIRVNVVGGGAV